jgi:hypothetical protein
MAMIRLAVPEKPGMWLGHYRLWLLWTAIGFAVANDATGNRNDWVSWAGAVTWAGWIIALLAAYGPHRERLCERCAAGTPLDPQAAVTRWKAVLRLQHRAAPMIAMSAASLLGVFAIAVFPRSPWALGLDAAAVVALGIPTVAGWKHRQLYPWCPFCHWGGGGPQEVSPEVPDPAASR